MQRIACWLLISAFIAAILPLARRVSEGALATTSSLANGPKPPEPKESPVKWRTDYDAARKEAAKRKLPMVVFFYAQYSFYCQKFEKATLYHPTVAAHINEMFIPLRINTSLDATLYKELDISVFPSTVVLGHDGTVQRKNVGFQDVDGMLAWLKSPDKQPGKNDPSPKVEEKETKINWRPDFNTARKEAEKRKLPTVVFFMAPGNCVFSEKMRLRTLSDPRVATFLNEKCVPLLINHSTDPELGNLLQVTLFPTIVIANHEGRILTKRAGFQDADTTLDTFNSIKSLEDKLEKFVPFRDVENVLRQHLNRRKVEAILKDLRQQDAVDRN